MIMIQFHDISKKFGNGLPVLDKVNFALEKGSFNFIVGPTGSGKTTIFRLIIKDLLPSEGEIIFADWNVTKLPKSKIPHLRRKIGFVFQDLKLLMDRTIAENVMIPLLFSKVSEKDAKVKAEEILTGVGLGGRGEHFPLQLSGGEMQRVAIARALVFEPEVILADEATGNLDLETSFQIMKLLEEINKKGTTIFMATHNEKIIERVKENVYSIEKGKVVKKR